VYRGVDDAVGDAVWRERCRVGDQP
jgi:hypothetical protein